MRLSLEQLEPRQLLATITLTGQTVMVVGTEFDDNIVAEIDGNDLIFSGSDVRIAFDAALHFDVNLLEGNDAFTNNTSLWMEADGGAGDDILIGGSAGDVLRGGAGADRLEGRGGEDELNGGGDAQDVLLGGDGIDDILGVTATYTPSSKRLTVTGTSASDEIRIVKQGGYLVVDGASQFFPSVNVTNIVVKLGNGNDVFVNETDIKLDAYGENGDDDLSSNSLGILDGGQGQNVLQGSSQLSKIERASNNTLTLVATDGNDELALEQSGSVFFLTGATNLWQQWPLAQITTVIVKLGKGDDRFSSQAAVTVEAYGEAGDDDLRSVSKGILDGGDGHNLILGTDAITRVQWTSSNLTLTGTPGDDSFLMQQVGEDIVLTALHLRWPKPGSLTLIGLAGNDRLINRTQISASLQGGEGNDFLVSTQRATLSGGAGNDYIQGSPFDDALDGGSGNDRLTGGRGSDTYLFATGVGLERDEVQDTRQVDAANSDTLDFRASTLPLVLDFFGNRGRADDARRQLRLSGAPSERIIGSSAADVLHSQPGTTYMDGQAGDDQIFGNPLPQVLIGGPGSNIVYGYGGGDTITGGEGNDRLITRGEGANRIDGGGGDDWIQGGDDNDYLQGGDGDDVIFGLGGDDVIYGSNGADRILGGTGNDTIQGDNTPSYSHGVLIYDPVQYPNILLGGPGDDIINGSHNNSDDDEDDVSDLLPHPNG